jgi:hypothetical protein
VQVEHGVMTVEPLQVLHGGSTVEETALLSNLSGLLIEDVYDVTSEMAAVTTAVGCVRAGDDETGSMSLRIYGVMRRISIPKHLNVKL